MAASNQRGGIEQLIVIVSLVGGAIDVVVKQLYEVQPKTREAPVQRIPLDAIDAQFANDIPASFLVNAVNRPQPVVAQLQVVERAGTKNMRVVESKVLGADLGRHAGETGHSFHPY